MSDSTEQESMQTLLPIGSVVLLESDSDGNGELLTEDYIDWRTNILMQKDTRYVGQLGYSFQSNVEGLK